MISDNMKISRKARNRAIEVGPTSDGFAERCMVLNVRRLFMYN